MKPERWGSLLVQEKYQEEKACDKRHSYRIIIIIIIIIINIGASNKWLTNADLFAETEGFVTAVLTSNYKKYILKQTDTDKQLAPTDYVKRYDGLSKIIDQKLAEAVELIDDKIPYYKYTPTNLLENENFKLYWNRSILNGQNNIFQST